jgi:ribosomal protein S18 acetylase RimI-like enzyme
MERESKPMTAYQIRRAAPDDIPSWLLLAKEVEHLFGPMSDIPEFQRALHEAVRLGHASCAVPASSPDIVGGIIISPASNSIAWLAVSRAARGAGLGRGLLSAGVADLDPNKPIFVQTFAPVSPAGATARQLYSAFGFTDHESKEPTPAGVPTILMRKPAGSDRG